LKRSLSVPFLLAAIRLSMAVSVAAQPASAPASRLLDVPYIQQSEELCGGAAAAMVMRYWGATAIRAESFASLMDESAHGIRGEDLLRDLRGRGWEARSFRGDQPLVLRRLVERQPAVAMIEDRPGYFHFVVIVGWGNGRVVYHDPARAPYRVTSEQAFAAAWAKADHWTMLVLPGNSGVAHSNGTASRAPAMTATTPCDAFVAEGVQAAEKGDKTTALNVFTTAAELCPSASGPLRESAGVYAVDGNWAEAGRLAREAVNRDRSDEHAWRILATSAYVRGDSAAALRAWNEIGEPVIDLVNVIGLDRTRHSVANAQLGLDIDSVLTTNRLEAAARRLADLPTVELARVDYRPLGSGRAMVEAAIVERSMLPATAVAIASMGVRLVTDRELAVSVASALHGGELITASWRWWENRPRIALEYTAPSHFGVWRADVFGEEQTYTLGANERVEQRRGGSLALSRWTSTMTRWEIGAGVDTWDGDDRTFNISIAADQRLARDRIAIRGGGALFGGSFTAWTSSAALAWRSSIRHQGTVALARAGFDAASASARLALWPGAGIEPARPILLRAHPLLDDGRISGDVFGRRVVHAGAEAQRWLQPIAKVIRLAPAVFVDTASAGERLRSGSAWHVDAGIGLRLAAPGSGVFRFDVAKGVRDGATAVSVGWVR
jgi:hypothetical protein